VISEILEGDRYILKTLDGKWSYKYSHDRLKKMLDSCVPTELDVCGGGESSGHGDASAPASEEDHFDHST
jgi:hypothetical protein